VKVPVTTLTQAKRKKAKMSILGDLVDNPSSEGIFILWGWKVSK